jgi:tetratricopeptide (TPR) repeat protein
LWFFMLCACAQQNGLWEQHIKAGEQAFQQGRYAEAESLLVAALEEAETFGPQDPRLVTSLNNLAGLYYAQRNYAQTEPLLKRALTISEATLGTEHPEVAVHLYNLALFYDVQGNYTEAEPLYQRALSIREQTLGSTHSITTKTRESYAVLLHKMDQEAEEATLESDLTLVQTQPTLTPPPAKKTTPGSKDRPKKKSRRQPQIAIPLAKKTIEIRLSYDEPTTNKDGSPLTDLVKTTIYYDVGNGPVKAVDVPATSPNGGGAVVRSVMIPVSEDQKSQVTFWITATDRRGNESSRSEPMVAELKEE